MTFNEYLQSKYIEQEHPLDDMIPDGFGDWLVEKDIYTIIQYAEKWNREILEELRFNVDRVNIPSITKSEAVSEINSKIDSLSESKWDI